MCEMPQAFHSETRKARKQHKCCECRAVINPGQQYQHSSGVWNGEPDSFKQCLGCYQIMQGASSASMDLECGPAFGQLDNWFFGFECRDFTGETFLKEMAKEVGVTADDLNRLLKVREREDEDDDE